MKYQPHGDSNPQSSDSKSDALSVRLCGHKTIALSVKNYIFASSLDKKEETEKCRPQRDSNPQSSDSKSDALSVRLCGLVAHNLRGKFPFLFALVTKRDNLKSFAK